MGYHIIVGDVMTKLMQFFNETLFDGDKDAIYTQRWFIVSGFSVIFILPLCLLKNVSALSKVSRLSIAAVIVVVVSVCVMAPTSESDYVDKSESVSFFRISFPEAIGSMSFAFVCHHCSFIVYNSLQNADKARWRLVSQSSIGLSAMLCLILSVTGYLYFRDDVQSDIIENFDFDNAMINVSRILFAVKMSFTFPMEHFVARHCVMTLKDSIFQRYNYYESGGTQLDIEVTMSTNWKQSTYFYLVTFVLWGTSTILGAIETDLGFVMSLTGCFCASALAYILPAIIIIKTNGLWVHRKTLWNTKQFVISFFVLIFGISCLLSGTIVTIYGRLQKERN